MFDRTARLVPKCRGATMHCRENSRIVMAWGAGTLCMSAWAQVVAPVRSRTRQRAAARRAGGREASGPLATSGDDSPELFDCTEVSINQIARRVHYMVERPSLRTSAPEGEDGRRSEVGETVEKGVGLVGPVRDHRQAGFEVCRLRPGWANSPRSSDPAAWRCRQTAGTLPPVS